MKDESTAQSPLHQPLTHDSAARHVTGRAIYTDDIPEPAGTLHAWLGCATETHAHKVPNTLATAASSGSDLNGMAALDAAEQITARLVDFAAGHWQVAPEAVHFTHLGVQVGAEVVALAEIVRAAYMARVHLSAAGSAFVILSHDHALDFLLVAQGLARGDAAYIGMIGSATKRARLARWCRDHRNGLDIAALTCPIGAATLGDKRPEVMAALTHRATRATICRATT